MKRDLVLLLAALFMGAIGGYTVSHQDENTEAMQTRIANRTDQDNNQNSINPFATPSSSSNNLQIMEQELTRLRLRLDELETKLNSRQSDTVSDDDKEAAQVETAESSGRPVPLSKESLVDAGVNESLAAEIMRRKSELEFQRLELRDRAIRENFINTPRYFQQLRELNATDTSLREDIGDDAYDRYLYASGQNNRVVVSSIMSGSPAEQSGLQKGDIIVRYNNEQIFNWNEIRQATTQGSRNEYVAVDIIRDGQIMNMVLPRGPLGVRLDTTRSNPDN